MALGGPRVAASDVPQPQQASGRLVAILGLLHASYLAALPILGLCGQVELGRPLGDAVSFMVISCWLPTLVYLLMVFSGYTLSRHPARALFVLLATPLQIAYVQHLVVGGAFTFFYESAAVQVGALTIGLTIGSFMYRPSGWFGAIVVLAVAAAWVPYCIPLLRALPEWSWEPRILMATSVLTSIYAATSLFAAAARRFVDGGGIQRVELAHGRSGIASLVGEDRGAIRPPFDRRWARWLVASTIVILNVGGWTIWIVAVA